MSGVVASCTAIARVQPFEFALNNADYVNVRSAAISAGWDGAAPVVCTLTGEIYYSGGYSPSAAVAVAGSFPGGVTVVNKAVVSGTGGAGGTGGGGFGGGSITAGSNGGPGGTALLCMVACTVDNQGTFRGGGGGGGGGGASNTASFPTSTNGGGGGGAGRGRGQYVGGVWPGGPGGNADVKGGNGGDGSVYGPGGGGAGATSGGTSAGNGAGGGDWGIGGNTASPGNVSSAGYGGRGGYAVEGNSYITWINTGTRIGGIV